MLYFTRRINDAVADSARMSKDVLNAMRKFGHGDWGISSDGDKALNDDACRTGDRILAAYNTVMGKIWIIADAVEHPHDRRRVTVLFPSEY